MLSRRRRAQGHTDLVSLLIKFKHGRGRTYNTARDADNRKIQHSKGDL